MFATIKEDIKAFKSRDPAAQSALEIILCYSGFHAVLWHRLSHWLWVRRFCLLGRLISQFSKILTGIEIHPGAKIGARLVIDHGTGIVIGESAIIGADVTLYQGVTLGGVAPSVDSASQAGIKRHPTLEDGVIIGSGAAVLGDITVRKNARVGSNAVVVRDVPENSTAVGMIARVLLSKEKATSGNFVAYGQCPDTPDIITQTIEDLRREIENLKARVKDLDGSAEQAEQLRPRKSSKKAG